MSEVTPEGAPATARAATAGGMLRQARQAQGLHIAALAAAIKVVPRKLELLESDQLDQLPDATFTRALAQTVCRTLKIDPAPVLALLPPPRGARLEQVAEGLNMPFRERPGQLVQKEWTGVATPALLLAALLVIAAVAIYLVPAGWLQLPKALITRATGDAAPPPPAVTEPVLPPAATAPAASMPAASVPAQPVAASAPPAVVAAPEELPPPVAVSGVLQLRPSEESWVEVTDSRGKTLISRLVQPGESVGLDGVLPFKVKIGNANATQVVFRGQPLELGPFIRDNMAKLEIK
ncbi:MAG: helix-turn-helix domain-containing protein [Burkholderiales bacterium]